MGRKKSSIAESVSDELIHGIDFSVNVEAHPEHTEDQPDALDNSFKKRSRMRKADINSKDKKIKKAPKIKTPTEAIIQEELIAWLKSNYPDVLYSADASGIKLNIGYAMKLTRAGILNRTHPDIQIIKACCGYHSLFIELKKEDIKLKKQNGEWSSDHLIEQSLRLQRLSKEGYCATFAVGLTEAKKIILHYLSGHEKIIKRLIIQ